MKNIFRPEPKRRSRILDKVTTKADLVSFTRCPAEPARAAMCVELMGGQALSAGELARASGTAPSTASEHLSVLSSAGLIMVIPQGRHRYYRLANDEVAELLEHLTSHTTQHAPRTLTEDRRRARLRAARTCYDHLAGVVAVELADGLVAEGAVGSDAGVLHVTDPTVEFFDARGVDVRVPAGSRRPLVRSCLDWTERRPHIGGYLGAALLQHFLGNGTITRKPEPRAVEVTELGKGYLTETFSVLERPLPAP